MSRNYVRTLALAAVLALAGGAMDSPAFQGPSLEGRWTLNRAQSQFPRDVGFGMDVATGAGDRVDPDGAGLTGSMRGNNPRPISEEQARNEQQLVAEAKDPPAFLAITQTEAVITIADERGRMLTLHPDGREEFQPLDAAPVATVTRWDGPRLVVRYRVRADRELRYTLSRASDTGPLVVQVQFVERGGRDVVTRIYDPAKPGDPVPAAAPAAARPAAQQPAWSPLGQAAAGQPPAGQPTPPRTYQPGQPFPPAAGGQGQQAGQPAAPLGSVPGAPPGMMPASPDRTSTTPLTMKPGSELRGLASLGVVIEGLSQAAESCGLKEKAIESLVTRSLRDAGLRVATNSDEDTYLYVRIVTTAMTTGFCFSRYDAILYTNAMATPTYGSAQALVQIELMRNGGLAGGGASQHAESVTSSLRQYVNVFATRIRDANR